MLQEKHVQILNILSGNVVTNSEISSLLYRAGAKKAIYFFQEGALLILRMGLYVVVIQLPRLDLVFYTSLFLIKERIRP